MAAPSGGFYNRLKRRGIPQQPVLTGPAQLRNADELVPCVVIETATFVTYLFTAATYHGLQTETQRWRPVLVVEKLQVRELPLAFQHRRLQVYSQDKRKLGHFQLMLLPVRLI